jgi:hypothetical protein
VGQNPELTEGIKMKDKYMKITDAEFALLCYIKEVARSKAANDPMLLPHHFINEVINEMLDRHCEEE